MKTAGIVAEYNPYHNGHRYLAEKLRKQGATHIAAVMSGHLVQRGEPAFFSKWARAEAALRCGVDLVIELPSLYAALSAERFALAAVTLLERMGCVDWLGFGSESGDAGLLWKTAETCTSPKTNALLRTELAKGAAYAAARQAAVERLAGAEAAAVLSRPNDLLGAEYCKALQRLRSSIVPVAVGRIGAEHDASSASREIASASLVREKIRNGEPFQAFVPEPARAVYDAELARQTAPCRMEQLETALLFQLRRYSPADFAALPDVSEGLESRLYRAAQAARSLEEFYSLAKTKRYAHARLRRISLYAALEIGKRDLEISPPYLRILGMNARGKEIAARMKESARLSYGVSLAKLARMGGNRVAELETRAGDLFSLGLPVPFPSGLDYTKEAVFV